MQARLAAVGTIVLVGAACDQSTGPELLDDALAMDLAIVAADATIEDLNLWMSPFEFGGAATAPAIGAPGRPGGHGGFDGEFSGTRSITFFDAEGLEMDRYHALETESMNIVLDIEGSVERDTWSATIVRTRDMTVSGLSGEEVTRTWNGSGTEMVTRSRNSEDAERSRTIDGTFEHEDVVVPIPGSDSRRPISGTIRRSMTVSTTIGDETTTRQVDIVITFDGDDTAIVTVNGVEMEIDLTAREGRNPVRRIGG